MNRAKDYGCSYPKNLNEVISNKIPKDMLGDHKLFFLGIMDIMGKTLNASSSIPHFIFLNSEWAAELAFNSKPIVTSSLRMTIGHELTHQENDYSIFGTRKYFNKENKMFTNWVNEIHADFAGAQKAYKSDIRNQASQSTEYKRKRKAERIKDKASFSHPSWEDRLDYIKHFDFNEKLIRDIATKTKCMDETLINDVINHFEPIILDATGTTTDNFYSQLDNDMDV